MKNTNKVSIVFSWTLEKEENGKKTKKKRKAPSRVLTTISDIIVNTFKLDFFYRARANGDPGEFEIDISSLPIHRLENIGRIVYNKGTDIIFSKDLPRHNFVSQINDEDIDNQAIASNIINSIPNFLEKEFIKKANNHGLIAEALAGEVAVSGKENAKKGFLSVYILFQGKKISR